MTKPASKRSVITIGTVCTVVGMGAGAFSTWAETDKKLATHIALAKDRVAMMCELADYVAASTEAQCARLGAQCPARPPTLRREALDRRCSEP